MSKPQFTPGPWIVFPDHNVMGQKYFSVSYGDDDGQICDFICHEADANLIAAAPDMYALLQKQCAVCPGAINQEMTDMYDCRACDIGRVLRKARGESEAEA